MQNKILYLVLSVLTVAVPFLAIAQDPGGGPDVPIDGGLSVLLAAGAAYGVKKYKDHRKNKADDLDADLK